jgi:hypothetical protein
MEPISEKIMRVVESVYSISVELSIDCGMGPKGHRTVGGIVGRFVGSR